MGFSIAICLFFFHVTLKKDYGQFFVKILMNQVNNLKLFRMLLEINTHFGVYLYALLPSGGLDLERLQK